MSIHQSPRATRPARLGELAKLPIFMDLVGCRTVVVPPLAGLFSAVGLLHARPEFHEVRAVNLDARTVDVWIGRLRRALKAAGAGNPLRTVRSLGYVFDLD